MTEPRLIPVDPTRAGGASVNVFIHGYRSMTTDGEVEKAKRRIVATGVAGESYLLRWMAGRWSESATVAGLRTAYRVGRATRLLSPWALLADAGVVGVHEVAQFKRMERRAEQVGAGLAEQIAAVAGGRPVNLIGHSLGGRVVHHGLASVAAEQLRVHDVVLLAAAADLDAADWPACVARVRGRVYNIYSRKDRVLWMTPDFRRRVGARPMPPFRIEGEPRVVNQHAEGIGHVQHWTHLAELLPRYWPGLGEA